MQALVTKDNVTILQEDKIHEGEYNVNCINFSFSEEYTNDLVKNAVFAMGDKIYQTSIINNQCNIPSEILSDVGEVFFGVYAYKVNDGQLELRYSAFPTRFTIISGSYNPTAEESQEITPSQFEQYMQALNDGLNKVEESLTKMDSATSSANDLVDDINQKLENGEFNGTNGKDGVGITTVTSGQATQQDGNTVTPITVNKTDGTQQTFNVSAKNGIDGINGTDGTDGVTPNLQIGTVTTLEPNEQATVTRTGTDEEPLFNFGIPKGQQGEQGIQGIPGEDGQPGQNGADGKDATINGQNTVEITTDNNITLEQQESVLNLGLNSQLIPKNNAEGTDNVFNDGLKSPLYALGGDGKSEQTVTQGYNLCNGINQNYYLNNNTTLCGHNQGDSGLVIETNGIENYTVSTKINQERYRVSCSNSLPTGSGIQEVTAYNGVNKDNTSDDITINTSGYSYLIVNATDLSSIQIVEGDTAKPFEPYTNGIPSPSPDYPQEINSIEGSVEFACNDNKGSSNQVTFNLGQEKLRSVGDVKDELVVDLDTGDYYKVENIGEYVFDGSDDENWSNVPDGTSKEMYTSSIIQNLVYTGTKLCQSNYFKSGTSENYYEDGTIRIAPSGGVSIYDDLFISMDNFKQWLSTNNTIVNYILKKPTTKKLGTLSSEDLAKLKTFYGYNNVTVNTNLGLMNIRFTYGLDIKKYVDNKIAELSAQLIRGE